MIALEEILESHRSPGNFSNFVSAGRDETEAYTTALFCAHEFRLARNEKSRHTQIASTSRLQSICRDAATRV